jgi:hypothetical protein
MVQTHVCVTDCCDLCGQRCWQAWDVEPRWPTAAAAVADVADVTAQGCQVCGPLLVCHRCAVVLACPTRGHEFGSGRARVGERRSAGHGVCPTGSCGVSCWSGDRCEHAEQHPAPAGHATAGDPPGVAGGGW